MNVDLIYLPSPQPILGSPDILFVHNYGSHAMSFRRHFEWLNSEGYNVITFEVPGTKVKHVDKFPLLKQWAGGVSAALKQITKPTVIFSFSNPSAGVILAMAEDHYVNIKGWITDGGPFFQMQRGVANLYREWKVFPSDFANDNLSRFTKYLVTGFNYEKRISQALHKLPKGLPILSIACEQDKLVKPEMIEDLFLSGPKELNRKSLVLKKSGHVTGLKTEPDIYKSAVLEFLKGPCVFL